MGASQPVAGSGVGHRDTEQGEAEEEVDEIEHGTGFREAASGREPVVARNAVNGRCVRRGPGVNSP